jgi:hypothetical protein
MGFETIAPALSLVETVALPLTKVDFRPFHQGLE